MWSRRRMAIAGLLATASLGLLAQPAAAIHHNATLDCGSAGTFTIKTAETGAGLFPPSFVQVDLLTQDGKKVGTLVPFAISINGQPLELVGGSHAADAVGDQVGFATCSFTGSNGDYVVLQGILNLP
jgi:hypothetical protein